MNKKKKTLKSNLLAVYLPALAFNLLTAKEHNNTIIFYQGFPKETKTDRLLCFSDPHISSSLAHFIPPTCELF